MSDDDTRAISLPEEEITELIRDSLRIEKHYDIVLIDASVNTATNRIGFEFSLHERYVED